MYKLIAHDGGSVYGINEYVCDTPEDISNLPPCDMGSMCLVISTGDLYIMNSKKAWVKI